MSSYDWIDSIPQPTVITESKDLYIRRINGAAAAFLPKKERNRRPLKDLWPLGGPALEKVIEDRSQQELIEMVLGKTSYFCLVRRIRGHKDNHLIFTLFTENPVKRKIVLQEDLGVDDLFSRVFLYSPIGLVVVDKDTYLYKVNKFFLDSFQLPPKGGVNLRFGNLFHCASVEDSGEVCGESGNCRNCGLRAGVREVLDTGSPLQGLEVSHDFVLNRRRETRWFNVSASLVHYAEEPFVLVSFLDITAQKQTEERLTKLGITDELTGLYNRRFILKSLKEQLENGPVHSFCFAIIDLDDFKAVNDTRGHLTGDEVLRLLSRAARRNLRASDIIGRYGGEEFLIIMPATTAGAGTRALKRIREHLRGETKENLEYEVSFSAGLLEVKPMEEERIDYYSLMEEADRLLYLAKAKGKNRTEWGRWSF